MKGRLAVPAVVAAFGVLVVLALLVVQFGREDPSPPSLQDHPDASIPGELLLQDDDGCFVRALASGASRREVCLPVTAWQGPLMWLDDHTAGLLKGPGIEAYDLDTGKPVPWPQPAVDYYPGFNTEMSASGERAVVDAEGRLWIKTATDAFLVTDFDVDQYRLRVAAWSPDGEWIAVAYSRARGGSELWLVSRDGSKKGTIATGATSGFVSWRIDGVGITPVLSSSAPGGVKGR